jgi:predicted DNA-binding protein (MmcQ/YjbR family)
MFEDKFFTYKLLNIQKLLAYGFCRGGKGFVYSLPVMQGQFDLHIQVDESSTVRSKMIERETGEEYILYRTENATGSFVGEVRAECEKVLCDIAEKCFDRRVFQSSQAVELVEYVKARYGDELEFLWEKLPQAAIWRRKDTKKWYAILMTVAGDRFGLDRGVKVEVIDLRSERGKLPALIDNCRYYPGYHMNKNSWYTILLDHGVSTQELCDRIDVSYRLAVK